MQPMATQVVTLQSTGGPQQSRYPPCRLWKAQHQSRQMCPEGSCSLWTAHTAAVSWQELWPVERSPHGIRFSHRNCSRGGALEQSVPEVLNFMERTYAGAVLEELWYRRRTRAGAREDCEEEEAETVPNRPQFLFPTPPALLQGKRVEEQRMKLSLKRGE